MSDLVLFFFGFSSIHNWKSDRYLGNKSEIELMQSVGFSSMDACQKFYNEQRLVIQKELLAILAKLWLALGKKPDQAQLLIYFQEFDGYPPERMNDAVSYLLQAHKWSNVPTIAEINQALKATKHQLKK